VLPAVRRINGKFADETDPEEQPLLRRLLESTSRKVRTHELTEFSDTASLVLIDREVER
jgi:hypothetical protein